MEIEAKFRVDDAALFTLLLQLPAIDDFRLTPAPAEQQQNVYFDTADGRLQAAGYGLRVRSVEGRHFLTLKRARPGHGVLRVRDEWNVVIADPSDLWAGLPADVGGQIRAVIGNLALVPLFAIHTHRRPIMVRLGLALVAELSLDHGWIEAGRSSEEFQELEVELAPNAPLEAFHRLVALFSSSFGLRPETRGKRSRGKALYNRVQLAHGQAGARSSAICS